jgi:hypothetical protein
MKLRKSSWHYKLYAFNSQLCAAWWDEDDFYRYPIHGTIIGLCPYMRMIMIWGPLVFAFNLLPVIVMVGALLVLPAVTIGLWSLLTFSFVVVGVIGAVIGLSMGMAYLKNVRSEFVVKKTTQNEYDAMHGISHPETFWSLLTSYVKSMKTKICPVLELDNE